MTIPDPPALTDPHGLWDWGRLVVTETSTNWLRHRTIRLGAGIAYYGLFAMVPLLAVSLAVAGLVVAEAEIQSYLSDRLASILGTTDEAVSAALAETLERGSTSAGLGLLGLGSLIFAASLLFVALQDAFNTIWEVPYRGGVRSSIRRRLVAFAVVILTGAFLIATFALQSVTALLHALVPGDFGLLEALASLFGLLASWALGIAVLMLLFRFLTDAAVPWISAAAGAAVTALLVAVGTAAIGFYLRTFASQSLIGAASSVLLALLWIYYEAQILLVGAELTRTLARHGVPHRLRSGAASSRHLRSG